MSTRSGECQADVITIGQNGASLSVYTAITNAVDTTDKIVFTGDVANTIIVGASSSQGSVGSVNAGILASLASATGTTADEVYQFQVNGNTWLFEHTTTSSTVSANDTLVEIVGAASALTLTGAAAGTLTI